MLIEIFGKTDQSGQFSWYIPNLCLDRRFNYKIALRHLNLKLLDKSQNLSRNELLCLASNLVDLSSCNPSQSVFIFKYDGRYPIIDIKPSIVTYNPVQLYEIENSSFVVKKYFEETELKFSQIFIHLEIQRLDSYGRVQ